MGSWSPSKGRIVDGPLPSRVVGFGEPTLVLLHGLFGSSRYWGEAYDELASDGSLVVPDLLGFGRAPRPTTGYTSDAHADAVAATVRLLDPQRPVVVAAHSVGCLVALHLAIRHPDLVAGIVAFGPPIHRSPDAARRKLSRIDPLARILLVDAELGARLCALMCRYRAAAAWAVRVARPALPRPLADDRVEHSWASYSETLSNLVLSAEAQAWLAATEVPVHLVAGSRDEVVDLPFLDELAARHRRVTREIVEGAGHDLPLTDQQRCIDIIRRADQSLRLHDDGA